MRKGGEVMIDRNNEQRAFPTNTPFTNPEDRGMTLRDWFAGQAMAGFCADPEIQWSQGKKTEVNLAKLAYEVADAMLEARKKVK
jgi:hypothetical protein